MPKIQKTVKVIVDRAKDASGVIITGLEAGYRISVQPWEVKPAPPPPPPPTIVEDELEQITWDFQAHDGLKFGEITVNFKTKKHFDPIQKDGSVYVLRDTTASASQKQIVGHLDPNFSFNHQNYNYILEFTLDDQTENKITEVELDPGYRVYP